MTSPDKFPEARFEERLIGNLVKTPEYWKEWAKSNHCFFYILVRKFLKILPLSHGYNFGDLLSPMIVQSLAGSTTRIATRRTLLALGSIMHFARTGDIVWGSGINGKIPESRLAFRSLDVRAVRGPLTRQLLISHGISCPEIYGDPALLLQSIIPLIPAFSVRKGLVILPNYNDIDLYRKLEIPGDAVWLSPFALVREVVDSVRSAEMVVTSSLHGLILSEVFGTPVRLVFPEGHRESPFKYEDYFEGTGRSMQPIQSDFRQAMRAGDFAPLHHDIAPLINAFPFEEFRHDA